MALEIKDNSCICTRCGMAYGRRKGYFPVSYSALYKGIGYIPICKDCIDSMYNQYLAQCNDAKASVRQMCRALNIYWNEDAYNVVAKKNTARSMMTQYIVKSNSTKYIGKCYDDTLSAEGTLWNVLIDSSGQVSFGQGDTPDELEDISSDVVAFWGTGLDASMYRELEQRKSYWLARLPDDLEVDIGTEVIIKQICMLELDINKARADGKPVDKYMNTLNTLLGSGNFKPAQKKQDQTDAEFNDTPMGVWLYRWENKRPLPDKYDNSPLLKYVFTWMGHVLRMLGKKNQYERLYQSEIDRLRVEKPEYDGTDEELMMDYMEDGDDAID